MGLQKKQESGVIYLSIIQGTFKENSSEDNPEAVKREYEDKNGKKGFKYEIEYSAIDGMLESVEFKDGDFGEQAIITITDVGEKIKVYLPFKSQYFTNFAKRLPNVNLSEVVQLSPYNFEDKDGKRKIGVNIKQNDETIGNAYYDTVKKKVINGLPTFDWSNKDKDDRDVHYIQERKFLKKAIEGMVFPKVDTTLSPTATNPVPAQEVGEEPDDLPF